MMSEQEQDNTNRVIIAIVIIGLVVVAAFFGIQYVTKKPELKHPANFAEQQKAVDARIDEVMANYTANPRMMTEQVTRNCYLDINPNKGIQTACTTPLADLDKEMIQNYFKIHPFNRVEQKIDQPDFNA